MNEKNYLAVRHKTVRKANELIQKSRFDLTMQQQKILLYLIARISPDDEDFKEYEFSIPEFCKVCGIDETSGKNYRSLKDAVKEIADKSLWAPRWNPKRNVYEETLYRWIEKPYIDENSGIIRIKLDNDMKPFLLQLKQNFTQYELIFTLYFKSKYSIRLYELVKSIHFHETEEYTRTYTLDELRKLLDAETYKTFQHFKDRVLGPAVKEINEHSDKQISCEFKKTGRSYTDVVFTIRTKPTLEVIRIRDQIDKELGTDQLSLWDDLVEAWHL